MFFHRWLTQNFVNESLRFAHSIIILGIFVINIIKIIGKHTIMQTTDKMSWNFNTKIGFHFPLNSFNTEIQSTQSADPKLNKISERSGFRTCCLARDQNLPDVCRH